MVGIDLLEVVDVDVALSGAWSCVTSTFASTTASSRD